MYHLFIATPEKVFFDDDVLSLVAPGFDGYFGVLTNHAAFISSLIAGKLEVTDKNQKKWVWALAGGFFEVKNNQAVILADAMELPKDIDLKRAENALKKAEIFLDIKEEDKKIEENVDVVRARKTFSRARNRIKISKSI